jgi:hypothetical protein
MSDWLSKLERRRNREEAEQKREEAARKAQAERKQLALSEYNSKIQSSYEQNKIQYERIYDSIEKYTKRASDAGYDVRLERKDGGHVSIVSSHTYSYSEGSYQTMSETILVTLELRPWGNGFLVHYNGRGIPHRETYISLLRVTDRVIADWVQWAANVGPNDPVGARRIKLICWIIGIALGLFVLWAAAANIFLK